MNTTNEPHNNPATSPCDQPYRPIYPVWLKIAVPVFIFLYLILAIIIEDIDLPGPVKWYEWIRGLNSFLATILPEARSSPVRILLNLLGVFVLHVGIPIGISFWLSKQTAAGLLQNLHTFDNFSSSKDYLDRLRLGAKKKIRYRPSSLKVFLGTVSFFIPPILIAILVSIMFSGQEITRIQFYYKILAAIFIFLLVFFCLMLLIDIKFFYGAARKFFSGKLITIFLFFLVFFALLGLSIFLALAMRYSDREILDIIIGSALTCLLLFVLERAIIQLLPKTPNPIFVMGTKFEDQKKKNPELRTGGFGPIFIEGESLAAVTESNSQFYRIIRSGFHQLRAHEYIQDMIELKQHEEDETRKFTTRDGIVVEMNVGVTFQVSPQRNSTTGRLVAPDEELLFPAEDRAIKEAGYTKTVLNEKGTVVNDWTKLPIIFVNAKLRQRIASMRYDDLFFPSNGGFRPHPELIEHVTQHAQNSLTNSQMGITLRAVRISAVRAIPSPVIEQQINAWRSDMMFAVMQQRSRIDADAFQNLSQTRQLIENGMLDPTTILHIQNAGLSMANPETRHLIAMKIIHTLDRLARRSVQLGGTATEELLEQIR